MKAGTGARVALVDLVTPMIGRLAVIEFADEPEPVKVRIVEVDDVAARVVVVPEDVKE